MDNWEVKYQAEVDEAKKYILTQYSEVWDTKEVQEVFKITSFLAPFCSAVRRIDGQKGTLEFGNFPGRVYFDWQPE